MQVFVFSELDFYDNLLQTITIISYFILKVESHNTELLCIS